MDTKLVNYLKILREKNRNLDFPDFCHRYSYDINEKKILVVLQDPGNSGAANSRECSIENKDPTARRQKTIIVNRLGIPPTDLLFWNFYPYFGWAQAFANQSREKKQTEKIKWADALLNLARRMDNLRLIVVCGKQAWEGMQFFDPICRVPMLWTPHPSNRGINSVVNGEKLYVRRWKIARRVVYDCR